MYLRAVKGGFIKGTILQTFLPTAPNLYNKIPIKVGDHLNTKHGQSKQMQLTFTNKRKINYVCIVKMKYGDLKLKLKYMATWDLEL